MKAVAAVLVTLLLGAASAEAGWWPKKKLPKPIDYPIVRGKVKESHKPGNKAKHPPSIARTLSGETAARA